MIVVPAKMRRLNTQALVACMQRIGVASRANLAKALGMSQPTAGKIVDDLQKLGVMEEIEAAEIPEATVDASKDVNGNARLGRPGRMLRLDQSQPRFLGIQLGVVETQLAPLAIGGHDIDQWTVKTPTPNSAEQWLQQLRGTASRMPAADYWGVLLSVPGIVDEPSGKVVYSPNLHWTEKASLPALVQQVWPVPAEMMQEERALALGHLAANPVGEDFLLVDFGQGVGGALVVGGKLYANPLPVSGELGHTPVKGNMRPCGCGTVGCVETLVSRRGLLQSFAMTRRRVTPTWEELAEYIKEKGVVSWLAEALEAAATIVAGALNVLGLRRVIITGSLTELPACVTEHLAQAISRGALWARFGSVECQTAPRRRTAGLVAMAIERIIIPMTSGGPAAQGEGPTKIH